MATLDLRAGGCDIRGHIGDDLTITCTIVDSGGSAVDVSGYTIQADVLRDGTSVATFTDSVGGAGNNVVTLSLTDTQTTAIGIEAGLVWSLSMTTGGTTRQYVGGAFRLTRPGDPSSSTSTSVTVTTEGAAITVTVSASGGGGASALDDLNDVTITTPSTGEVLKYNGSAWVNGTDATEGGTTALDDLTDVTITSAASGDILRHNGTTWVDTPGTDHYEAAGAVSTHNSATTSVHGIADTSALLDTADIGVSVQAYSSVLAATTASFTTADESKLDGIEASATANPNALDNVVEDTTPQLGGTLDAQGNSVENLGAVEEQVNTVAATGATETLDVSAYGVHDCTMDQNCEFTFSNPAPSGDCSSFVLILRGAFTPTLPGSIDWSGGAAPSYSSPSVYAFVTVDGGTTWLGSQIGASFA